MNKETSCLGAMGSIFMMLLRLIAVIVLSPLVLAVRLIGFVTRQPDLSHKWIGWYASLATGPHSHKE